MSTQSKLVRLGITSSVLLGAALFPQLAPALGMVEAGQNLGNLGILLGAIASVAGGNVANAIDAFQSGTEPGWVGLENEDLTGAVGKAIASVLILVADSKKPKSWSLQSQADARIHANLSRVANSAAENWLAYRREDYSALQEENIEAIITPALTEHFPKALLQVIKEDFAKDGRAYAALSLKLLTGLRAQLNSQAGSGIHPTLKTEILARVGELETGLTERVDETFQQISSQIESGFAEVCEQLGVVTTGIDQLLTGQAAIQDDLGEIKADVETLLAQAKQPTVTVSRSIPSNLPFSATANFIGRQDKLTDLNTSLRQENRLAICAVNGMGGIGKTELALQYALQFSDQYPGGLCWLSCREADIGIQLVTFGRSTLGLAIPEQGELAEQLTFCWNQWPTGDVLLIYDDVTDYSALQPYLPPANLTRFTALLTSRLRPNRVSGIEKIDLTVLSLPEALALLTALAGAERIEAEPELATQLCEWVGRLPLALELLGAYLAEYEDCSLSELWEELQAEKLNSEAFEALAGELRTPKGVVQTFELSWQALSPKAQELVVRLSLFASAPFSWEWVAAQLPEAGQSKAKKCRDRELMKRSLLQQSKKGLYELHPLLWEYLVTKQSAAAEIDQMKRDLGTVMVGIARQVPQTLTLADLAAAEAALPHLETVAANLSDWLVDEDLIWPFVALGRVYEGQSQFPEAEKWYGLCVKTCQKRLGDRHPDTAISYGNLAGVFESRGDNNEALPLRQNPRQKALEIHKEQLGDRHPDTASSYNNLAGLYSSMGRYEEALPLSQLALEIIKEQLGERHPDTATSYNNLAGLYYSMGRTEEALPLYQLALEIVQSVLGDDYPNTQTIRRNYEACRQQSRQ